MAQENLVTNIVAKSDFSDLIADLGKVSSKLISLQSQLNVTNRTLAAQAAQIQQSFAGTLRSTGQFSTQFVSLSSDVEKFGKNLDSGRLKLSQYYKTWQDHTRASGGLIRQLAQQQVQLQNAILQPLGKNAQGLMQYNVHIPAGLDKTKHSAALARQELQIMNKVMQQGANQLINWGKNTQWAGRQLTVGLTLPLTAFGKAAADAFRLADQELVRLTKVYGGIAATNASDLKKIREDVSATARELSQTYGASYRDTIALAADIAATGKQGNELLKSTQEATRLSILGEVDRQEAMKATLAIQTAFKQNTSQLAESINFLNAVENQTSTSLSDLVEAIPKAGPVVQSLGGSVQDLALYLTAMREGGISASEGANALKSALASLINPTNVAKRMFADFGIDLEGIVTKNAGNLTGTILELQRALDTLNPLQKQQAIEQLFGKFQFSRLNALFANLGKQGSQTLQVLDLMKTSSSDLANIAGRELAQITESASGKYRRALETLRADLAQTGESFLNIGTKVITIIDKAINFFNKLPDPVKNILGFVGGLTALAGPIIMLTGLLANFFGYIVKGIFHFKSLFKGGEGWRLLTPEILAAEKAGSLLEATFYSDAKAASVLSSAIANLSNELRLLETRAANSAMAINPAISTIGGSVIMPGKVSQERVANPAHPLIGGMGTRASMHMNPLANMTQAEKDAQNIFSFVPGPGPVNLKIGRNPQAYMSSDLPKIDKLTAIGGASTGVVAQEAAKWHSMTAALSMQSEQEIAQLKAQVAATGAITDSLSESYQMLLPKFSEITANAAQEVSLIVSEVKANKITVDQARARIVALNAQVEAMMAETSAAIAATQGRVANITTVPLTGQPVVDPTTGRSNMKEMFHKSKTSALVDKIARSLGVKTYGGGYSIETTMPKRFNQGNIVPGTGNMDTVPAMLTPGEFVVNAEATRKNLPLLQAINGPGTAGPLFNEGSNGAVAPLPNTALLQNMQQPFMIAGMVHQGRTLNNNFGQQARSASQGVASNVIITNKDVLDDLINLHNRGLHPMGLFYEQGVRLGYDKEVLKIHLRRAYDKLVEHFSINPNQQITFRDYEDAASRLVWDELKGVTRESKKYGRQVSFTDELRIIGEQRGVGAKGRVRGSSRQFGFDDVKLPTYLVGTGSGFSGAQNIHHVNLSRELFETVPSKALPFGKEDTISKVFDSQRGHIGLKETPSKWNKILNIMRQNLSIRPAVHQRTEAERSMMAGWRSSRAFRNAGGPVGRVQYFARGGEAGRTRGSNTGGRGFSDFQVRGTSPNYPGHPMLPTPVFTQLSQPIFDQAKFAAQQTLVGVNMLGQAVKDMPLKVGVQAQMAGKSITDSMLAMGTAISGAGKAAATSIGTTISSVRNSIAGISIAGMREPAQNWNELLRTQKSFLPAKGTMLGRLTGTGFGQGAGGMAAGMAGQALMFSGMGSGNKAAMAGGAALMFGPQLLSGGAKFLTTLKATGGIAFNLARILKSLSIPGLVLTGAFMLGKYILNARKEREALNKAEAATGGAKADNVKKIATNYETLGERIKRAREEQKLYEAATKSALNEGSIKNIKGLTLTYQQLKDAVKSVKQSSPKIIAEFKNAATQQDVTQIAKNYKAAFVASGMSIEEATNAVYALITASGKGKQAVKAIADEGFVAIQDKATAAKSSIDSLNNAIKGGNQGSMAQSLLAASDIITQSGIGLDKLNTSFLSTKQIGSEVRDTILAQNKELGNVINSTDTFREVLAKAKVLASGIKVELSDVQGAQLFSLANYIDVNSAKTKDFLSANKIFDGLNNKVKQLTQSQYGYSSAVEKSSQKISDLRDKAQEQADKEKQAIQDKIDLINKEADARLKALDATKASADFESELAQATLEYQNAIATGNVQAAAAAKARIDQVNRDRQYELARTAIEDDRSARIEKFTPELKRIDASLKKTLEALKASEKGLSSKAQAGQAAASNIDTSKVSDVSTRIENFISRFSLLANPTAEQKQALVMAIKLAMGELQAPLQEAMTSTWNVSGKTLDEKLNKLIDVLIKAKEIERSRGERAGMAGDFGGQPGKIIESGKTTTPNAQNYPEYTGPLFGKNLIDRNPRNFGGKLVAPGDLIYYKGKIYRTELTTNNQFRIRRAAVGGFISGPGNGTSDSIPAMLSNGEYVIKASAVRNIGVPMLDQINRMAGGGLAARYDIPSMSMGTVKYANGGLVSSQSNSAVFNFTFEAKIHPDDRKALINDTIAAYKQQTKFEEIRMGRSLTYTAGGK
jgi:TP901 family phage tail tape measure protein